MLLANAVQQVFSQCLRDTFVLSATLNPPSTTCDGDLTQSPLILTVLRRSLASSVPGWNTVRCGP